MPSRPVLVLTGPPAVGKSTTARTVAESRQRCAVIDVDDVRQLVVSGGAAPWDGEEGRRQQRLGVRNACALAGRMAAAGFDVVVADVLTAETLGLYRALVPDCVVVRLSVPLDEAWRRAATRTVWLTDEEFVALHEADTDAHLAVDHVLDGSGLDLEAQTAAVAALWDRATRLA
ncbi:AAA family ATPase [Terracoccus sp. 273MFTsu3.1]|uniref:AAA family ATPase n=1 Tax=Terracoccus sp. 273MFTsu3.1 TaxID=1172188 RepID=UPI0003728B5B|nr:AAA family ATPase [Terracoccus sp. 273MFTsu3.1]